MHTMDAVQVFNDELQSLLGSKPSVSKAKMVQITRAAMKGVKFYKHVVQAVEKFIARCRPEYMIPGLYVIDSIVRQSRHQFGPDRDVYTARFSRNIMMTFETLFANCLPDDKPKIVRVLNLWQKNGVFEPLIVQPLMDMASTASSSARAPPSSPPLDTGGGGGVGRPSNRYIRHSERGGGGNDDGLKFNKDMLDFDYDEDDDDAGDETPTEAEPPLSSTLNKMGIEHRGNHKSSGGGGGASGGNNKSKQIYQSNQGTQESSMGHPKQSNQDAVLERWQRIVNGQSTSSDSLTSSDKYNRDSGRSRSRSPPPAGTYQQPTLPINKQEPSQEKSWLDQNLAAKDAERAAERERRCLPKIRDKHITVCSATLWLGHVPKNVTEVDVSDAFGEYGTIHSIDLVPPRGCAYVCMDRRQDAKRALNESKDIRLKGSQIKMAWAPGKGFKEYKKLKDFWEADVGASFIPYSRIDSSIDFEVLEEGGVIDEESLSIEMRERRERQAKDKKTSKSGREAESQSSLSLSSGLSQPLPHMPVLNQPVPPTSIQPFNMPPPNLSIPPPTMAIGQGLIHFPPPGVTTTSSGHQHILLPPPSSSSSSMSSGEKEKSEDHSTSIDHQLSMTERQISMVEQQLNMIQQAQGIGRAMQAAGMPPNPQQQQQHPPPHFFHQLHHNQPDPMIFNMPPMHQPPPQMMQNMLDPALAMFANNPMQHLMGPPPHMMMPASMPMDNYDQPPPNMNSNDQSVIQID